MNMLLSNTFKLFSVCLSLCPQIMCHVGTTRTVPVEGGSSRHTSIPATPGIQYNLSLQAITSTGEEGPWSESTLVKLDGEVLEDCGMKREVDNCVRDNKCYKIIRKFLRLQKSKCHQVDSMAAKNKVSKWWSLILHD